MNHFANKVTLSPPFIEGKGVFISIILTHYKAFKVRILGTAGIILDVL